MIEGGGVTTRIKTTAPTLPPPLPHTPQLLIFPRLTQDNTFPSFPHIPSLPLPNPPQVDMSIVCRKCEKLFITQADYDAHPCNQATSSSSGQRAQSSQQPINVSTALLGEVRAFRQREDNLEEQITQWTSRLVSRVKKLQGSDDEVQDAQAGVYNGLDVTAGNRANMITQLQEKQKV